MSNMFEYLPEDVLKLLLAVIFGGIIGIERELRSKAAGFRTMILICVGSCFFTDIALHLGTPAEASRIVANIITGIGFLGAGAIFRDSSNGKVSGMTTASMIWIAAAIGMGLGFGEYFIALVVTIITQVVLLAFTRIERPLDAFHEERTYITTFQHFNCSQDYVEELFREHKLKFKMISLHNENGKTAVQWVVHGSEKTHRQMLERLIVDTKIESVKI